MTRPLLIAELGIGHQGDMSIAHDTIDACADAGLRCVKFQCHIPDVECAPGHPWLETIERCSFDEYQEAELKAHVEERHMSFLSTPFSLQAVERLERLGVVAYKIGSGENRWFPLIEAVARTGKDVFYSCGMGVDLPTMRAAHHAIERYGGAFGPMHCVSKYPSAPRDWRLDRLQVLLGEFGAVGLSDHSRRHEPAIAAVANGALVVELHVGPVRGVSPDAAVEHSVAEAAAIQASMHAVWEGSLGLVPDENEVARLCERDAQGRRAV